MRTLCLLSLFFIFSNAFSQNYPEGFNEEIAFDQFTFPAGYIPVNENTKYVFELDGKVWSILDGEVAANPILDISEEVGMWADHGLIGLTIDPNFVQNGFIYLLYNVDRHYLLHYGTENYDPLANDYYKGGMGRVTRYTINTENFSQIIEGSRKIILGENIGDGVPIPADSHGVGAIKFGEDGSLLISTGDSNSFWCCYNGDGPVPDAAYDSLSYQDGILKAEELIGAFRSQYLNGLNGKILRIHPENGDGLSNNPFYDQSEPGSAKSKIWALGFRNPFRFTVKPGTGFGDLQEGHPGELYVSDVGESQWEELNIIRDPGTNYGWPIYEGQVQHIFGYPELLTANDLANNPLFGTGNCMQEYFNFQDLIVQDNQQHEYFYPNPCDPFQEVPQDVITFNHERPAVSYSNFWLGNTNTQIAGFDENGAARAIPINSEDSYLSGQVFSGSSGNGGTFISGPNIPEEYQNWFILSDYSGWVKAFNQYENGDFKTVETWQENIGRPVSIDFDPYDGCIYICTLFPSYVKRICFGGNLKPIIKLTPDTIYGTSPFTVNFDASESYDPEGDDLSFEWNFDDGTTGAGSQISHTFTSDNNTIKKFEVSVTVSDSEGAQSIKKALVSLNNTPPEVSIISITEGELYSTQFPMIFNLRAQTTDLEHSESEISYNWTYRLQHNTHFHVLENLNDNNQSILVNPTQCIENENYWYSVQVIATDPGGLQSTDFRNLYPDCDRTLEGDVESDKGYVLLPNPADNRIEVRSSFELGSQIEFEIYGIGGKSLAGGKIPIFNNRKYFRLDVSNLAEGIYVLSFRVNSQEFKERFAVVRN